jgi:hypothetical protein
VLLCVLELLKVFRLTSAVLYSTIMIYSWTRPEDVAYPITYATFHALDIDEIGELVEYRIQDLPEERFEDAVAIIKDKHLIDEPMKSSKGVRDCPVSVQEMVEYLRSYLQQKISLVCFKAGSDEIVAVNILGVMTEAENNKTHKVSVECFIYQQHSHHQRVLL